MLATVSPLPARTVARRVTISGVRLSWPLSAKWDDTSCRVVVERGTISAEPALMSMRGGMLFMLRKSASLMLARWAASATVMVVGTDHTVQLAYWPSRLASRLRWKTLALSQGSRICGVPAARITGRLYDGLRARKSSSRIPASVATSDTSMSCVMSTVWK